MTFLTHFFQNLSRHREFLWRLAFIVVISFFAAKLVNLIIAHKYLPLELPQKILSGTGSPGAEVSLDEQASAPAITSRNIFDSEARKRSVEKSTTHATGELVPSTLPLELLGTMVFRNEKFSVALIRDRNSQKSEYYSIGQNIQSATLVKIERFRVILDNGGRLETLELKAGQSSLTSKPTAAALAPIEDNGTSKVIPQAVIDDVLSNFGKVLTQARMIPNNTDDNKIDGFKIFQIKAESIYEKLGLKDNDIIKRVNGQDLDNFEKATGLLTALRNEKTISIDVVRNGTKVNYTYEIR
ncbi:MAG: hypothetical protein J0L93_11140 [Deltaproteobacteria bacterium]|nr:hypothetical protein [Deltaproteobacteria bacterium]